MPSDTPETPSLRFAPASAPSVPLAFVAAESLEQWLATLPAAQSRFARAQGFTAGIGATVVFADDEGAMTGVAVGRGTAQARARGRFALAAARAALPAGVYHLDSDLAGSELEAEVLGWLFAGYRFDRYHANAAPKAALCAPEGVDAARIEAIVAGECLTRDLINTPANDMGPQELEEAAVHLANHFGASHLVVKGDDLLAQNFPMIHAVGRAAVPARAPRLIELNWGDTGPLLTLVGKGVCFDTGGLNIKPGASMGLMKKDMGGAATVLGLAQMIMALKMDIRLRVLIPAVENAIAGDAFRPGDILQSRKGLTVEVNNTDAEGRLVLADALALADAGESDLVVSFATLTGAARVAVGPDLAPFFASTSALVAPLMQAGETVADPLWNLPFWAPYETMIEPGIADLDNAPAGGMAGAITAALFLKRFVTDTPKYVHFDIYGWCPAAKPARPKGGVGQGARALLDALPELLAR
ncbi:Peptidase B [Aquimixticola soesokkakensis]|uniref:Peptidase B n=1 Tax=Aquimixticola soesokkakensis TaxID=1519096 RepID=A0A1Y5REK2_9RHOB|nr:leucyl aminopeptidase family protein [Aquimixticola soesokkakensis]SLN15619.1 Peptidase B [Aquimixticola soesokkakensis]